MQTLSSELRLLFLLFGSDRWTWWISGVLISWMEITSWRWGCYGASFCTGRWGTSQSLSIDLENVLVLYSLSTATKSKSHGAWLEQDALITLKFWGLQVPDPSVSKADFFFPGALGESGPCLSLLLVCCKMDCAGLCKLSLCLHDTHSAAFSLCFGEDTSHAPSSMTLPYVVLCAT